MNPVTEKIKILCADKNISAEELAENAGLTVKQIELIFDSEKVPSLSSLIKISRALGVRLGTFLDDNENIQECAAWVDEDISMNTTFFRFKDASEFNQLEDVLKAVNKFSFWLPTYIMLNGTWYDTYEIGAVDENGNTIGSRF